MKKVNKLRTRQPHVAEMLIRAAAGESTLRKKQLDQISRHLLVCARCAGSFHRLESITQTAAFKALEAHNEQSDHVPDDNQLADFATLDPQDAAQVYPDLAVHIMQCPRCYEQVEFARSIIDAVMPIPVIANQVVNEVAPAADLAASAWQKLETGARLLVTAIEIGVRRLAVALAAPLMEGGVPIVQITARETSTLALLDVAPTGMEVKGVEISRKPTSTIDLPIDPARGMLQLAITWQALQDKRLSWRIRAMLIREMDAAVTSTGIAGEPATGLHWQMRAGDPTAQTNAETLSAGITDARGESAGYLDPELFGSVTLSLTWQTHTWEIPLTIADEVAAQTARGDDLLDQRRLTDALDAYNTAMAIDHTYAPAYAGQGRALLALGRPAEARAAVEHAIGLDPDNIEAYLLYGAILSDLGRPAEALAAYARAIDLDPASALSWNGRGNTLLALGRPAEALEAYARATDLDPASALSWNGRGNALSDLGHIEEAIAAFLNALQIFTLAAYPEQYADTQNNLGITYRNRIAGERRANLEEAIACFQRALRVFTLSTYPEQYAQLQNNLGMAYQERIAGERRANLEEAIACFQRALLVFTLSAYPEQYAQIQNNLGLVYQNRIAGERRGNLEEAIACYQRAFQIRTPAMFPFDYAMVQNNLGMAYQERIAGERRANLEEAIACFQRSLEIRIPTIFPIDYAMVQRNLGTTFRERIAGDRRQNLEEAIAAYQSGLRFVAADQQPELYQEMRRAIVDAEQQLAAIGHDERWDDHDSSSIPRVFLSYAHADRAIVAPIADFLRENELLAWDNEHALLAADSWFHQMHTALANAQICLVIWTEAAARSRWVENEVRAYLELQQHDRHLDPQRRLLLIRADAFPIPEWLWDIQAIALDPHAVDLWGEQLAQLITNTLHASERPHQDQAAGNTSPAVLIPTRLAALGFRAMDQKYVAPPVIEIAPPAEETAGSPRMPAFAMAEYPVTLAEYTRAVWQGAVAVPTFQGDPTLPVVGVTWEEATAYAAWLANVTGEPWRLPTAAEWELAAHGRMAKQRPRHQQAPDRRRAASASSGGVTPIGTSDRTPSLYGCRDMGGNIWEWTGSPGRPRVKSTSTAGIHGYVACGGAYHANVNNVTYQQVFTADRRIYDLGFRLAKSLNEQG